MQAPLSSSQKTEILRRQGFACAECQTDLEPVGSSTPHFVHKEHDLHEHSSITAHFVALCASCSAKSNHDSRASEKARRPRDSGPAPTAKKFVKSGHDPKKNF